MLTYDTPALWQTGSRNLTGQKTLPKQFLAHLYELLPSLGVRRPSVNFKKKSSPLKPLGQFKPNLA
jgi:hypothetical protein